MRVWMYAVVPRETILFDLADLRCAGEMKVSFVISDLLPATIVSLYSLGVSW